jgi:hypothetical protein
LRALRRCGHFSDGPTDIRLCWRAALIERAHNCLFDNFIAGFTDIAPFDEAPVRDTDVRERGDLDVRPPDIIALANKVEERMIRNDDGTFAPLVEGGTKPVATVITHAGIVKTQRWSFSLPQRAGLDLFGE